MNTSKHDSKWAVLYNTTSKSGLLERTDAKNQYSRIPEGFSPRNLGSD